MLSSQFVDKETAVSVWQKECQTLQDKLKTLGDVSLVEGLYPTQKHTIQYLANVFSDTDQGLFPRTIRANSLFSEKISAGSGMVSTITSLCVFEELKKGQNSAEVRRRAKAKLQECMQSLQQPFCKTELDEVVSWCFGNNKKSEELKQLSLAAIEMAGMNGSIRMDKVDSGVNVVEKQYGYFFPIKANQYMLPNEKSRWEFSEVKVFCVDGLVESVAELDKVLNGAFAHKTPTAIIAQGFAEEVVATVLNNNKQKRFNVCLFELEQSLNNMNVISDFSVVCGPNCLLSILTGELVSMAKYDELPTVDFFSGGRDGITVRNLKTRKSVNVLINELIAKKQNYVGQYGGDELEALIEARIKNLLANTVIIRTSDETVGEVKETEICLDNALRSVRSAVSFGLIDLGSFDLKGEDPYTKAINKAVKTINGSIGGRKFPVSSLLIGIVKGMDSISELMESAGVVTVQA